MQAGAGGIPCLEGCSVTLDAQGGRRICTGASLGIIMVIPSVTIMSNRDLMYNFELTGPMTMLRVARPMLLCRVLVKGPEALISLVVSMSSLSRGWTSVVISDLK